MAYDTSSLKQQLSASHWLFQGNPERYDLRERLVAGEIEAWSVTRYASRIQEGDTVWFWRARERALYGWGVVEEAPARTSQGDIRCRVRYLERFDPPISVEAIQGDPVLASLMVLRAPQGTNFRVTAEESAFLVSLVESMGMVPPGPGYRDQELPSGFTPLSPAVDQLLPLGLPGIEGSWLSPILDPPVLQTVDLLAGLLSIGERPPKAVETQSSTVAPDPRANSPVLGWLRETVYQPGSEAARTVLDAVRSLGPGEFRDDGVTDQFVRKLSEPVLTPALSETIDRALQIEAAVGRSTEDDEALELRLTAVVTALLFSDWPGVRALLLRMGGRAISGNLRNSFLHMVRERFGDEVVARWAPHTRIAASELVRLNYAPDVAHGEDLLGIAPDVQALASVIASRRLTPPLSVGLFGHWGSGKSFFMGRLRRQIEELVRSARVPDTDPKRIGKMMDNPESDYLPNIVQVEFNAWHYVEADLWASLVTHLFDNLRVQQDDELGLLKERRKRILEEMEASAKLAARKEDERASAEQQLNDVRDRLRELQRNRAQARARLSAGEVFQALTQKDLQGFLTDKARKALTKAAEDGDAAQLEEGIRELTQKAVEARGLLGRGGRLRRGLAALGGYNLVWLAFVGAAVWVTGWGLQQLNPDMLNLKSVVGSLVVAVGGVTAWLRRAVESSSGALTIVEGALERLEEARAEAASRPYRDAEDAAEQDLMALENEIAATTRQLEQAAARLEEAQAELVDIDRSASLAHFIEERVASGDYRERLGLLALIRQDFERLSHRIKEKRKDSPAIEDPVRIDRIVLYIDDLDRCPPERVYDVLQAIHLLLAFDLFVVVVGVDERWLSRSLTVARAGLLKGPGGPLSGDHRLLKELKLDVDTTASPTDFLEKIFQVPFWLRPMNEDGFSRLVNSMIARDQALTRSTSPPMEDEEGKAALITVTERRLIQDLPLMVGTTPEALGRFMRIFRSLKARYMAERGVPFDDDAFLPGALLLALATGRPTSFRSWEPALHAASPDQSLPDFVPLAGGNASSGTSLPEALPQGAEGVRDELVGAVHSYLPNGTVADLQDWLPFVSPFAAAPPRGGADNQVGIGDEPEGAQDIAHTPPETIAIGEREASMMRDLSVVVGRSPRTAKRFVNLYRVLKAREFIARSLTPLRQSEYLGGLLLLGLVTGNPAALPGILSAIEGAPEGTPVPDFFRWDDTEQEFKKGLASLDGDLPEPVAKALSRCAAEYLTGLSMGDLQRWAPTVRRFSFSADVARMPDVDEVFYPPVREVPPSAPADASSES